MSSAPLSPNAALLCKLASAIIHADEYLSPHGHELDRTAFSAVLNDPEVKLWLDDMTKLAMAPRKRVP